MLEYLDRIEEAIWFRRKFRGVLESGEKTGTLRVGRRIPGAEILAVILTETKETIGHARIREIAWFRYGDLNRFPSVLEQEYPSTPVEIDREMKLVYPSLTADDWVTFYAFTFVPTPTPNELGCDQA